MSKAEVGSTPQRPDAPERKQVPWPVHLAIILVACLVVGAYDLSGRDEGGWAGIGHGMATLVGWGLVGAFTVVSGWLRYKKRAGVRELVACALVSPIVGQVALTVWLFGGSLVSSVIAPRYDAHVTLERWWQRTSGDELEVGAVVRSDVACSLWFFSTVLATKPGGTRESLSGVAGERSVTVPVEKGAPVTVRLRLHRGTGAIESTTLSFECSGVGQRYEAEETEARHDTTTSWVLPLPPEGAAP